MVLYIIAIIAEIGAGYNIYLRSTDSASTIFTYLLMLVGLVFLFLAIKEDKKNKDALMYIHQGYEIILLYASYLFLLAVSLGIIFGLFNSFGIGSPFIMVMWLLPLITMLVYQGAIIFTNKSLKISNKEISYKSIRQLEIEEIKNKKKITFYTKDGNFSYKAKAKIVEQIEIFIMNKNKNIKIKSL